MKNMKMAIESALALKKSGLFLGDSGIGKSAIVKAICAEKKIGCKVVSLASMSAEDLSGYPKIVMDKMKFFHSDQFPTEEDGPEGILFFDEANQATPDVLNALYSFVHSETKAHNGYKIPEGWIVVIAGNEMDDDNNSIDLPRPLIQRCAFNLIVEADFEFWKKNFADKPKKGNKEGTPNICAHVMAYLMENKSAFAPHDKIAGEKVKPSPRGWTYVSELYEAGIHDEVIFAGIIGKTEAIRFATFSEKADKILQEIRAKVNKGADISGYNVGLLYAALESFKSFREIEKSYYTIKDLEVQQCIAKHFQENDKCGDDFYKLVDYLNRRDKQEKAEELTSKTKKTK